MLSNLNSFINRIQEAFISLDHVTTDPGDHDQIHQVWDYPEEIGDDVFARIRVS